MAGTAASALSDGRHKPGGAGHAIWSQQKSNWRGFLRGKSTKNIHILIFFN